MTTTGADTAVTFSVLLLDNGNATITANQIAFGNEVADLGTPWS